MMNLSIEIINLICIFDTSTRAAAINGIRGAMPDFYDPEMLEIAKSALAQLESITDDEFDALDLTPVFDYDDESEV